MQVEKILARQSARSKSKPVRDCDPLRRFFREGDRDVRIAARGHKKHFPNPRYVGASPTIFPPDVRR